MSNSLRHVHPLRFLADRVTAGLDSIKLNSVAERKWAGHSYIVKRRCAPGRQISALANVYFGLAHVPIRYWSHLGDWQRWELDCFRMLNRDEFEAFPVGADAVCLGRIPGQTLWSHLQRGTITRRILRGAAEELRRAHHFWSDEFNAQWSHGDASMSNFIYDEKSHRVRLIDFEIIHEKCLPAAVRHADDLLVFLLDLAGFVPRRRWLPLALAFLKTYDRREVMVELRRRLVVPSGIARIWWNVRSNFVGAAKIGWRLTELRQAMEREGMVTRRPQTTVTPPASKGQTRQYEVQDLASGFITEYRMPVPAIFG
jgi:hypothetical protein